MASQIAPSATKKKFIAKPVQINRRAIEGYIQANGQQDTRDVIALFAKRFNTTKQRISGNISCMKCREQSINIISNKPHSIMY